MLLYLMRHGIAANKLDDPQRGLTPHGVDEIEKLAYALAARGVHFNQVIHSNRERAKQTALIMRKTLSPESAVKVEEKIQPNDDIHILHAELDSWQEDTLVVGHLPFMPSLVSLLTDHNSAVSAINFEPGTVVCLNKLEEDKWEMEWVCSPSLL